MFELLLLVDILGSCGGGLLLEGVGLLLVEVTVKLLLIELVLLGVLLLLELLLLELLLLLESIEVKIELGFDDQGTSSFLLKEDGDLFFDLRLCLPERKKLNFESSDQLVRS